MAAANLLLKWGKRDLWSPYLLTPSVLKGWWSARDHGTILMTDDGGGLISSWKSRTPDANALTATTTARPTWTANIVNSSYPGVVFDGVANCLVSTTLTNYPTGSAPGNLLALIGVNSTLAGQVIVNYGAITTATGRTLQTNSGSNATVRDGIGGTSLVDTNGTLLSAGTGHMIAGSWTGTTEAGRRDGTDFSPNATATIATLATGTTRIRVGSANGTSAGTFYTGPISEVFITTFLTAAQIQLIEGYLAWTYWSSSATNPLPSSHPYKFSPP